MVLTRRQPAAMTVTTAVKDVGGVPLEKSSNGVGRDLHHCQNGNHPNGTATTTTSTTTTDNGSLSLSSALTTATSFPHGHDAMHLEGLHMAVRIAHIPHHPNKITTADRRSKVQTPPWVYGLLLLFVMVTVVTCPRPFQPQDGRPTVQHVFFYGWLTAISTGLGVCPFFFLQDVASFWVGISNGVAAGMMVAASYSLFVEGATYTDPSDTSTVSSPIRTVMGCLFGLAFILGTKKFLDKYEDLKVGGLGGADARKALLVFFVMTLHSFSEGVGIGVSFGGSRGTELGVFISASLAVHNVPEGLAIAVVLLPRGLSACTATLWAVCTSLPQPLMALPAYLFVNSMIPFLPVGLGFAGGAMAYVALFELLLEAVEDTSLVTTCLVALPSCAFMLLVQSILEDGTLWKTAL